MRQEKQGTVSNSHNREVFFSSEYFFATGHINKVGAGYGEEEKMETEERQYAPYIDCLCYFHRRDRFCGYDDRKYRSPCTVHK